MSITIRFGINSEWNYKVT